jgi:ribose transport system substrate-binding protein
MNRKIFSSLSLALAIGVLASCNRGEQAQSTKPTIAVVVKTLNHPFFIEMEKGARAAADSLGVELVVQAAEREVDVEKQMQIIENLIERKVSALAIAPSGSREIVPAIVKANKANIPVVIIDTRADAAALQAAGGKVATFIGSDNYSGGRIAGEYLAAQLKGKGNVVVLEGIPGHETGDSRLRGFREAIAKNPGIKIVASQTANWERDQGFNVMQNMLQSHPDVNGVFAASDLMALGAVEALSAAQKKGVLVIGFDALDDARKAINEGRMAGSVAQHPGEMGRLAVISAAKLLKGETLPADQPVTIELITKDNAGAK